MAISSRFVTASTSIPSFRHRDLCYLGCRHHRHRHRHCHRHHHRRYHHRLQLRHRRSRCAGDPVAGRLPLVVWLPRLAVLDHTRHGNPSSGRTHPRLGPWLWCRPQQPLAAHDLVVPVSLLVSSRRLGSPSAPPQASMIICRSASSCFQASSITRSAAICLIRRVDPRGRSGRFGTGATEHPAEGVGAGEAHGLEFLHTYGTL